MYKKILLLGLICSLNCIFTFAFTPQGGPKPAVIEPPKLVLTIVIDQFRADYLMRFKNRFLPAKGKNQEVGGFAYLMANSAYYPYSEYEVFQNHTAAGHATILTGTYPYQGGIPLNEWFSYEKNRLETAVEDAQFPLVGLKHTEDRIGTSPNKLFATTLGDELKNAGYPTQVVSVALKDRAAILLGGHRADLAIWYDAKSHSWISSRYYLPTGVLPAWMIRMNEKMKPQIGETIEWKIENSETGYSARDAMPNTDCKNAGLIGGKDFPHFAKVGTSAISSTPYGLELTRLAAENALDAFRLGRGAYTDILAVSFSSHDVVGHAFGPNSREMEEMTIQEDRQIAQLLNHVRKTLPRGLKNVVVVLTGDHGGPPTPEWAKAHQIEAGRIDEKELVKQVASRLDEKFGKFEKGEWIHMSYLFNVYLNQKVIQERRLSLADVQKEVKLILKEDPRIAYVVTSSEIAARVLPPGIHEKQVLNGYSDGRSGDVLIIPKPYFMPQGKTVIHLTGYAYDRTVPLLLSGAHFRSKIFTSGAHAVDIAPTLALLTGVVPPSLSEGRVLSEALDF